MPHMDFKSKVLRLRDSCIFTVQELGSVGYRRAEKMCFVFLFLQEIMPCVGSLLCGMWNSVPPVI
jgi:hypothetical protein